MSVNYSTHRVDVPVTDLDDDDDILFNEQMGRHVGNIDDLDFGINENPPFWKRFTNYFRSNYSPIESYELRDASRFDINDEDDEDDDEQLKVQDTKIKRLINNPRVAYLILSITLIIGGLLFGVKYTSSYTVLNMKPLLSNSTHEFYPTTIVISLDGFHPHYISPKLTPALHDMMMNEFGAPYMTPSFPSSTFPNHWTLITGLYPSEHGIVGNTFYDPKLNKQFVNTNPKQGGLDPDFWQGGEPIWKTAFKQGVNSAVHMWPGSEVPGVGIDGGPLFVDRYNGSELLSSKVKRVMGWLDEDIKKRPELILTYVPTVDSYGHKYGISGDELKKALTYVDDFVSLMRKEISHRHLDKIVNLIVVSDHGMAPTSNDRLLYLDDIIDLNKIEHIDGWPLFGLRPFKEHSTEDIFKELQENLSTKDNKDSFDIFRLEDLPEEWNFGHKDHKFNYRLAPIWIVPKVGYSITTHSQMEENNNDYTPKGVHGYNNTELLMRALFVASGPYFKSSSKIKPFKNTEVYNIICNTLNLVPSPNNGSFQGGQATINLIDSLPDNWTDDLIYPDLPYEVDHLVEDATYDLLWKPKEGKMKTVYTSKNPNPEKSIVAEESTFGTFDPSLPKPSDFSKTLDATPSIPTTTTKPGLFDNLWDDLSHLGNDIGEGFDDLADQIDDTFDEVGDKVHDVIDGLFDHDDQ
ncbi:ectonucleotide pyrophosphatase/phosphodiesterase 1 [[Candida] jaroonii]|uniref:Ectonucleotide pyrophosphatase/phosphodiesterase 1 n=1 Tax=[Candida] jaroonii TaxID=467808 RepID=A0ACA9Y3X4_9ASCO|nr:ectonucleotide pyrophosphatase/phosphodiesterase 1 [[Candida] jaroonii]